MLPTTRTPTCSGVTMAFSISAEARTATDGSCGFVEARPRRPRFHFNSPPPCGEGLGVGVWAVPNHFARRLRRNATDAEKRLWHELRMLKHEGRHFRRQVPIAGFIADFACYSCRLII